MGLVFLSLLILLATLILSFAFKFIIFPWRRVQSYKKKGVPTYFFPLSGIFNLCEKALKQRGDFMAYSKESSKIFPDQKFIVSNVLHHTTFYLRDPQYFREFLTKPHFYEKSDLITFSKPLAGTGLVFTDGETWKRHRKIISHSFHFDFIKSNIPLIQDTAKEFFDNLSPSELKNYSVLNRMQEITGEIVGKLFFGESFSKQMIGGRSMTQELIKLLTDDNDLGQDPLIMIFGEKVLDFPLFPKFNRLIKRIRNFRKLCFDIVENRKKNKSTKSDLLSSLLATQELEEPDQRYSDEDIVNEFITFFVAGMDTTGHLIGMAIYILTQYPQYLQGLEEERKTTYNQEEVVTTDSLSKMNVLHSIFKELLRLYPPGPFNFFRRALEDHKILDLEIKKDQIITTDFTSVFCSEKYFSEPEKFDPTRWTKTEQKLDPYAFIPFSAGPRNCIGQHLAIMEAKIITSEFLERFEFKLKEGYQFKMTMRFLYEPEEELIVNLSPRKRTES